MMQANPTHTLFHLDEWGHVIDAKHIGNSAQNGSIIPAKPNLESRTEWLPYLSTPLRDIKIGEELSYD